MSMFGQMYAGLYDQWYREKDYAREVQAVLAFVSAHSADSAASADSAPGVNTGISDSVVGGEFTVLDLGCGTGRHLENFVEAGLICRGYEPSPAMAALARERLGPKCAITTDAADLGAGRFDVVTALFDVLSYQTTLLGAREFLSLGARSLRSGGLLVVDAWHLPGVVRDPPGISEGCRDLADGSRVSRRATSVFDPVEGIATIDYQLTVTTEDGIAAVGHECHRMRCFTVGELSLLAESVGLVPLEFRAAPSMSHQVTGDDWHVAMLARRGS
ncbi:MAG: class I SAM-dependent methyltransferase [Actinomycetales bacterium]|nr:class I SAM-dependent methyltransferase [Actinomycetales bacterium]